MDEHTLRKALDKLPLGGLRFFTQTGSTNDVALAWATSGAPDLALVYAEEQTSGRGRGNRNWFTPPGAALAFSLVIVPSPREQATLPLFSALGALAVCEALSSYGLQAEIKWPNDVLLNRHKVSGILAESVWTGDKLESVVLGIGINIKAEAVPPSDQLLYPATSLAAELPKDMLVDRIKLLDEILQAILYWRNLVAKDIFLKAWESRLAFKAERVEIRMEGSPDKTGKVMGLGPDGSLRLLDPTGEIFSVQSGEVHLRPVV